MQLPRRVCVFSHPTPLSAHHHHYSHSRNSIIIPCLRLVSALFLLSIRYAGIRARTTAAPQQHWFGPSGDPRAGGIHTAEAIKLCWSSHREIIHDYGPVSPEWNPVQT